MYFLRINKLTTILEFVNKCHEIQNVPRSKPKLEMRVERGLHKMGSQYSQSTRFDAPSRLSNDTDYRITDTTITPRLRKRPGNGKILTYSLTYFST
ncbi:unnamed protein product [Callosobruchus maculatus]|uniref:Uncharacterized protein n=1 Tax=Callosobruchus maculatus TaxID=64391 RepID=A0A653D471_CALMS|nr:unnamed protein product [Callosobruchus maculatus]